MPVAGHEHDGGAHAISPLFTLGQVRDIPPVLVI